MKFSLILKKLFPKTLKQIILQRKVNLTNHKVLFGKRVLINNKSFFEGFNSINNHSELTDSYIGLGSYIANNSILRKTKIGRFCSIGDYVRTGLGKHPTKNFVSTHPAFFSLQTPAGFTFTQKQLYNDHDYVDKNKKYFVIIGNDVWVGNNVLIMDGIKIADGAIIAAGSIVTKNVEPYTIVAGIPAKPIRKRFSDKKIDKLLEINWWNWPIDEIANKSNNFVNIDNFFNQLIEKQ